MVQAFLPQPLQFPLMKKIVFTEAYCQPENLFPFTLTRRIQDIRVGILTIREKWERALGLPSFDLAGDDYKDHAGSVRLNELQGEDLVYLIHGNLLPTPALINRVKELEPGTCLSLPEKESIVYCIAGNEVADPNRIRIHRAVEVEEEPKEVRMPWEIFQLNAWALMTDYQFITGSRTSAPLPPSNRLMGNQLFLEEGARIEHCIINTEEGPVYIGKNAVVMEGSLLRGPLAICEGAVVKMGARIYGATTIGPYCTAGGEIKNVVFFGYSNKAHDGYLGDSVIGEWCNLGAGSSNSNVRNTASEVTVWTPRGAVRVGLKCGVMMGDYSRTAINTAINTGTVVGVCSNLIDSGLTPKFIPSFSWGADGLNRYRFDKALEDISNWKALKGKELSDSEIRILHHIFDHY
jgi:UDP-N-acetylglucosamine diphosphorylase/glucosamine-1-phosphate N-acetyltransferase